MAAGQRLMNIYGQRLINIYISVPFIIVNLHSACVLVSTKVFVNIHFIIQANSLLKSFVVNLHTKFLCFIFFLFSFF